MPSAIRVIEHLWIPLDDGRRLAARLWLPALDAPVPAILEYLPYRKRDATAPRDATTFPTFADADYAGIRVDIAGSGEADGLFDDEYSERELADAEAVIDWIADQPWCDGNVGMIGISWGGFSGLQLAFRRPKALRAIVTACSTADRYRDDTHFMDGCLLTDNFGWSGQMTAFLTRPPDPLLRDDWLDEWLARIDKLPFLAAIWQRHSLHDAYWKHGSVAEDWSAIRAATLAIGGWADAYLNTPPALAAHLDVPTKALMGPWEHKYPHIAEINPADFHAEVLGWFDRWLKGVRNGAEDLPAYRAFMQEHDAPSADYGPQKGRWIAEKAWPSPFVFERTFCLTDEGLSTAQGVGEQVVVTSLRVGQASAYWCPGMRIGKELAGDQAGDDDLSVCFDTAPLDAPLELLGRAQVEIAFTVDRPVAQLCCRLCDVAPDGVSQRISFRVFNLAHHAGHEAPMSLRPGDVYRAKISLNECAHHLQAGHRLRLAVSTSYWPLVWPAPEAAAVTLRLADCRLILPERRVDREIDPAAPGPPQAFPRYGGDVLRPPSNRLDERVEDDGTYVRESFDDFGMLRDPDHGLAFGSQVTQIYAIHPDDPLSARHEVAWRFEFRRGDWSVRIDSENVMTSDVETFRLERKVVAYEGDAVALERRWQENIPRVCCELRQPAFPDPEEDPMTIEWKKLPLNRRRFMQGASALGLAAALPAAFPRRAAAADGGTLRTRTYADMRTLDPAFSQGVVDEEIQSSIYNKLIQYKPGRDWDSQLDAATMIEQIDPTHIKFALRDDIGFTNGFGAMSAEDVKFSFERIIDKALESSNKPDMGPLSHVEVTGEREGVIVLNEPFAPFWSIALPYITGNIVSKNAVEATEGKRIDTDPLAESGPYLRKEWKPKEKTVLVRNPDWKGEAPAFDVIEILPIDDENTAEIAFEAGELDFTRVSLGSVERFRGGVPNGGALAEYPSLYYVWLGMNLEHPKLQNEKLRQAIQHAIDVPSILEAAYFGAAEAATGIIAPGLIGHREQGLVPPTADFEKAAALLAESGESDVSLTLDVINKTDFTTAAQVIQATLSTIGVNVEINVHEAATFWTLGDESAGEHWKDVQLIMNRFSMTPDPYYATSWFTTEQIGVWNWERFSSGEFDKLHAEAAKETDGAKRAEMYSRAQDLMEESGAYRFITHEATPVVHTAGIAPALRPDGLPLLRYFGKA